MRERRLCRGPPPPTVEEAVAAVDGDGGEPDGVGWAGGEPPMSRPPRESDDVVLYYSIPSSISSYHRFKSAKTNTEGGELKACRSAVYIRETKVFFSKF